MRTNASQLHDKTRQNIEKSEIKIKEHVLDLDN